MMGWVPKDIHPGQSTGQEMILLVFSVLLYDWPNCTWVK